MKLDIPSLMLGVGVGVLIQSMIRPLGSRLTNPDGDVEVLPPGTVQVGPFAVPPELTSELGKLAQAGVKICVDHLRHGTQYLIDEGGRKTLVAQTDAQGKTTVDWAAIQRRAVQMDEALRGIFGPQPQPQQPQQTGGGGFFS